MFLGPRRIVLIGAIVAIAVTIITLPLLFASTAPDLNLVDVRLSKVSIAKAVEDKTTLKVTFTFTNPTTQTATTSKIEYSLFADEVLIGQQTLSYENVPPNGRPPIFGESSADVSDQLVFENSKGKEGLFAKITQDVNSVKWSARGTAQIESTLTTIPKDFQNEI